MKKIWVFFYFVMAFALQAEPFPHLILHFDINKTLIASDKTENKSLEDVINELLSREYSAYWDESLSEPLTFDAYVKTILLPGPEYDVKLKEERLGHLIHFIDYLYEKNHPLYHTVLEKFNLILEVLKNAKGNVFPSFYRLIFELNHRQIPYTIFLRSFGKEIFDVKNEINSIFKDLFKHDGIFQKGILYLNDKETLSGPQAIYNFFCSKENAVIRDDWRYWVEGEMGAKYGKPFYMDPEDPNTLTLFFDDNIKKESSEKNIIAPMNSKTGGFILIPQLVLLKQLIPVHTLEAILDERYYIERVEEALQIYRSELTNKGANL